MTKRIRTTKELDAEIAAMQKIYEAMHSVNYSASSQRRILEWAADRFLHAALVRKEG